MLRHMIEIEGISYGLTDRLSSVVVLCRKAQMQVEYGSGSFRKSEIGSIQVESGNANEKLLQILIPAIFNADKSAN